MSCSPRHRRGTKKVLETSLTTEKRSTKLKNTILEIQPEVLSPTESAGSKETLFQQIIIVRYYLDGFDLVMA